MEPSTASTSVTMLFHEHPEIQSLDWTLPSRFISAANQPSWVSMNEEFPLYFDVRFGPDCKFDASLYYIDKRGTTVYFAGCDPASFKHVLTCLQTQDLPNDIGNFQDNPQPSYLVLKGLPLF